MNSTAKNRMQLNQSLDSLHINMSQAYTTHYNG